MRKHVVVSASDTRARVLAWRAGGILAAAMATIASARQDKLWNDSDASWFRAESWNPVGVPTAAHSVAIRNGGFVRVTFASFNGTARARALGVGDLSIPSTLAIGTQGALHVDGTVVVGSGVVPGTLIVSDSSTLKVDGFGDSVDVYQGSVSVSSGSLADLRQGVRLGFADTATLNVSGSASSRGVVKVMWIRENPSGEPGTINLDGGVLRGAVDEANFLQNFELNDIKLLAGGGFIDTNGFEIGIPVGLAGAGALTKQGAGTLTLNAASTYSGGTVLEAGTVSINDDSRLGQGFASVTLNGGTLRMANNVFTPRPFILLANGGMIEVPWGFGGAHMNFSPITGSGTLTKIGEGTLQVTGNTHTFTGATHVRAGNLTLFGANFANTSELVVGDTASTPADLLLDSTASVTTGGVHIAGNDSTGSVTVGFNSRLSGGAFITVGDNFTGVGAGGTGALSIGLGASVGLNPGAKLTLGWVNAMGTVTLGGGGTLEVNGTNGIQRHPTGTANFNFAGGTIKVMGDLTSAVNMAISQPSSAVNTNGFNAALSGDLTGFGTLNKTGAGTLTLSGSNSYSGGTVVHAGTLSRTAPAAFPNGASYTVNGGTLNLANLALTATPLQGTGGTINIGTAALTVNQDNDTEFSGSIAGTSGSLRKQGSGELTLSGASSYLGGTAVDAGVLLVNGSIQGPVIVSPGAIIAGTGTINGPVQVQADAALMPGASPGRLTVGGLVALDGALGLEISGAQAGAEHDQLVVTSGDVTLGAGSTLEFGAVNGTIPPNSRLFILSNTGPGALNGSFAGLPDGGSDGTPVPDLEGLGGYLDWRIYYHADNESDSLSGGNDIALAAADSCPPDFNGDGFLNGDDFDEFVAAFEAGDMSADYDGNEFVNGDDFDEFVVAFEEGC